ncbi:hypothetical protein PHISCL_10140 [Aspergillus sclerotialis]|uniref:Uncharacterized protein n=1 Tax=Aspergillus sclerotialis TaxID=2070753 RepID=A0A3A2Z5R2_9EURO|nr:hypothetical protein PHISCL_10140 [Aspergillus sclerotialis]
MASNTFVPSTTYNTLPLISDVARAPKDHSQDLQDLRELLNKHKVPEGIIVRLIHRHFNTAEVARSHGFLARFQTQAMGLFRS